LPIQKSHRYLAATFISPSMASTVLGVRIHGDSVTDADVRLDDSFKAVPVPNKLGIPLVYKMMSGTGGDDSDIRSNSIVRFMADPDDGFAPDEWQYGGRRGPAPPVVLARKDKIPFSQQDWHSLDEYMAEWREETAEAEDDRLAVSARWLTPDAHKAYVRNNAESAPTAFLSMLFPVGSIVVPSGLSVAELNGQEGTVVQFSRDRVGVSFPDRAVTALRPEKLTLLKEPASPALEPATKRQDTGEKLQRKEMVDKKEALQIAARFIECLQQDTFPEMDDLHLFGIGGEYRARAQEALAVWQGSSKNGDFDEELLAHHLSAGTQEEFFHKLCFDMADSRLPNATYAKMLVGANFAALEFDKFD